MAPVVHTANADLCMPSYAHGILRDVKSLFTTPTTGDVVLSVCWSLEFWCYEVIQGQIDPTSPTGCGGRIGRAQVSSNAWLSQTNDL